MPASSSAPPASSLRKMEFRSYFVPQAVEEVMPIQPPQCGVGGLFQHALPGGEEARPETVHDEDAVFLAGFVHALRGGEVVAKGLFAEDVFVRLRAHDDVFLVQVVRRGDVDHVDAVVLEHFFIATVGRAAVFFTERAAALNAARADCDDLCVRHFPQAIGEGVADNARPQDRPTYLIHPSHSLPARSCIHRSCRSRTVVSGTLRAGSA